MDQGIKIRWAVTVVLGIVVALVTAKMLRQDQTPPPEPSAVEDSTPHNRSRRVTLDGASPRGPSLMPPPKAAGTPAPEGDATPDEGFGAVREEVPEDEGSDHAPFLLDSPESLTAKARLQPLMSEVGPDDVRYDSIVEARQIFAPFEDTLLDADPLTPEIWKAALETHRERNAGVLKRADFLRRSGYAEEAGEMMVEWSRLYGVYQARAYGR